MSFGVCLYKLYTFKKWLTYLPITFCKNDSSSVRLDKKHFWTSTFMSCYLFSIGPTSGLWLDHLIINHVIEVLELLSFWKVTSFLPGLNYFLRWLSSHHLWPVVSAGKEKHPHSTTLPPPCFLVRSQYQLTAKCSTYHLACSPKSLIPVSSPFSKCWVDTEDTFLPVGREKWNSVFHFYLQKTNLQIETFFFSSFELRCVCQSHKSNWNLLLSPIKIPYEAHSHLCLTAFQCFH